MLLLLSFLHLSKIAVCRTAPSLLVLERLGGGESFQAFMFGRHKTPLNKNNKKGFLISVAEKTKKPDVHNISDLITNGPSTATYLKSQLRLSNLDVLNIHYVFVSVNTFSHFLILFSIFCYVFVLFGR